eukprot:Selendium_serpulae@DN4132_c0_g1_i1.p1
MDEHKGLQMGGIVPQDTPYQVEGADTYIPESDTIHETYNHDTTQHETAPGGHDLGISQQSANRDLSDELTESDPLQERTDAIDAELKECLGAEQDEMEDDDELERRSVYVGNVDYSAKPQELQEYFKACGRINRVTIMVDKYSGRPKGFAYIEFTEVESISHALLLNDTLFRNRQIKVISKRKNIPGYSRGRGRGTRPRARGFRGRRPSYPRGGYGAVYRGRGARASGPYT